MAEISRFLLVFDHELGRLRDQPREFRGDSEAAEALDAVKATHGRFFRQREELASPSPA